MLCWPVSMLCCQATQPAPGVRGELHPHQPGGGGGLHEWGHRKHRALRACLPSGSAHRAAQHLPQGTPQVASWVPWGRSAVVGDVVVVVELVLCILLRNVYLKVHLKRPHEFHEVGRLLSVMLLLLLTSGPAHCAVQHLPIIIFKGSFGFSAGSDRPVFFASEIVLLVHKKCL